MPKIGLSDIITYSVAAGACFLFAGLWMLMADRRARLMRRELERMRSKAEDCERERYILAEGLAKQEELPRAAESVSNDARFSELETRLKDADDRLSALMSENEKIRKERDEAMSSLEEVYKALGG